MSTSRTVVIIVLILGLLLAGCAKQPTTTTPGFTTVPPVTPTGTAPATTGAPTATGPYGALSVAVSTFAGGRLYPLPAVGTNIGNVIAPMFDFMLGLDDKGLAPAVIVKWELSSDGLSWNFDIRKGIYFHNGKELTAADIKFTFERYASGEASATDYRAAIKSAEIIDEDSVRVYTQGVQPYLPHLLTNVGTGAPAVVIPEDYIEQNGSEYFERHPIGTGSFKFVRQVTGDLVEYEALNSHWRQVPDFKKLTMIQMPEETTRVASLKTGGVDAIDVGLEEAKELEAAGFKTSAIGSSIVSVYLWGSYEPQTAKMPVSDIRVRKALSLAINRDEIIQTFFIGKARSPVAPALTENSADIDVPYWQQYSAKAFRYDTAEAKSLLKEAGYSDGFTIKLFSYSMGDAPFLPKLTEIVQGYWQKVGVRAEIVPVDYAVIRSLRTSGPNRAPGAELMGQASLLANSERPVTPSQLRLNYHSLGSFNLVDRAMPELDKLIDGAMSETDAVKRQAMIAKALQMGIDSYVALTLCTATGMSALSPKVDINFPRGAPALGMYLDLAKHRNP